MTNKDDQSFYLAIVGHDLHLSYFSSEEDNSNHQKKYLMPDSLDDNLNLTILTKFILEKVKDFEKDVGSFIEKANVITDVKYNQFSLSLKSKHSSNQIKETDIVRLISDAKQLIMRNNKNCHILHIFVDQYIIDGVVYSEFPENLDCKEVILDVSFITINSSTVKMLNRIFKDCNIEVKKFISYHYSSKFADNNDSSPCIAAKKVNDGINPLEVKIHNIQAKRQGLFEKMFNLFN